MDKEQYSSFDDWFREAAAQPGPEFNEAAWKQMEARLDGEKKKRRRIIFWWWFTGILVGASLLLFTMQHKFGGVPAFETTAPVGTAPAKPAGAADQARVAIHSPDEIETIPEPVENRPGTVQPSQAFPASNLPGKIKHEDQLHLNSASLPNKPQAYNKFASKNAGSRPFNPLIKGHGKHQKDKPAVQKKSDHSLEGDLISESFIDPDKTAISGTAENKSGSDSTGERNITPDSSAQSAVNAPVKDSSAGTKKVAAATKKTPEKKTHFYLFGAIAPEWSYIHGRGAGNAAFSYGGGIGYAFSQKWAIQAGLFSTGKKYFAGEGDYSPKPGSYYDNPMYVIESVDANCAVLEIPVAVRYTFLQKKTTSFYALVAVNATIMKKEDYYYDYKRYGNQVYSSYTYKTGIAQVFSAASISMGIEQKLNKKFSIMFAPYFNLPLRGIGEGRVYLRSFGFQGGLKYSLPF